MMNSEVLFLILMVLDVAFVLICFRLGKNFLFASVISNIMFTNMVSSKIVTIFGLDSTVANVFYAAIFLATDLINEFYGRKTARAAVWLGFVSLIPIIVFAPFVRLFEPTPLSSSSSNAIEILFSLTPRIAIASITAYLIANFTDIWIFQKIRNQLPAKKHLWIRKNGSTFVSQGIDQLVFCTLAFAFAMPWNVFGQILLSGYIIKVIVAASETPIIYLANKFGLPNDLPKDPINE